MTVSLHKDESVTLRAAIEVHMDGSMTLADLLN
jgi:hypothetical protein